MTTGQDPTDGGDFRKIVDFNAARQERTRIESRNKLPGDDRQREAAQAALLATEIRHRMRSRTKRIQSPKVALRLARNLAPMLKAVKLTRKDAKITMGEIAQRAGISQNPDETRLGRFRVGENPEPEAVQRLSRTPTHWLNLAEECARALGVSVDQSVIALVDGTYFHPSSRGTEEEKMGYERLHDLVSQAVSILVDRHDFDAVMDEAIRLNGRAYGSEDDPRWAFAAVDPYDAGTDHAAIWLPLSHAILYRGACEVLDGQDQWQPAEILVMERVQMSISRRQGDPVPTIYLTGYPRIAVRRRRGLTLNDLNPFAVQDVDFITDYLPAAHAGEIVLHGQLLNDVPGIAIKVRVPQDAPMRYGYYERYVDYEGDPWDVGRTARFSLSSIEEFLGTTEFMSLFRLGDLVDLPANGFVLSPEGTLASRLEANLLWGQWDMSNDGGPQDGVPRILTILDERMEKLAVAFQRDLEAHREQARRRVGEVLAALQAGPPEGGWPKVETYHPGSEFSPLPDPVGPAEAGDGR